MSQSRKITPYILHTLSINSVHNHKDLLRKRPSKGIKIRIAETLRSYSFPSSYSTKLIKLLKHIKGLKRLVLDHFHLLKIRITLPSIVSLIKKIRRIQELTLNDFWMPVGPFATKLNVWMKYIKDLPKLTFKLEIFRSRIYQKHSFSRHMKCFLNTLRRRQTRMKSLKIQLPQKVSFVNPILLLSKKYPQSLLNLQLLFNEKQHEGNDPKLPDFRLDSFEKLEALTLQTTDNYFVMSFLMETLPSLPDLKSLSIFIPHSFVIPEASLLYGPHSYHIDSQAFSNLTHLSVRIPLDCTEVTLFERLNLTNLQSLQLSFFLVNPQKYQEILSNLPKMKRLKTLKLSIIYRNQLKNLIKLLFENIVNLELLTSLRIFLVPAIIFPEDRPKEEISFETLLILDKIIQKPTKIEDLTLECRELIISHKFSGFMDIFHASASNFKKFKLDAAPFVLDEGKIEVLTGFIEGLGNVRTLKLSCFDIDSNQVLNKLASAIVKLKEIRSISLGKVGGEKVEEQAFLESLGRILEKRGLQSLKCELIDEFHRRIFMVGSPLSFEDISKKNPFLESVPFDISRLINERK